MDNTDQGVLLPAAASQLRAETGIRRSATIIILLSSNACSAALGGLAWLTSYVIMSAALVHATLAGHSTAEVRPLLGLIEIAGVFTLPVVFLISTISCWVLYSHGRRKTAIVAALVPLLNTAIVAVAVLHLLGA